MSIKILCLSLILCLPLFVCSQSVDSLHGQTNYATLFVYHPKGGFVGSFNLFTGDTVVCKVSYNSKHEIKLYKEGATLFWARPKNENQFSLNVKFGEVYYLRCRIVKQDKGTKILFDHVEPIQGVMEYARTRENEDSLKAQRTRKWALDTVPRRNTIYAEAGGQAILYSINYDRVFRAKKRVKHSASIGFELIDWYKNPPSSSGVRNYNFLIPISYYFLIGKGKGKLELGLGTSFQFKRYYEWWGPKPLDAFGGNDMIVYISPKIGWRFQPKHGGFFFKTEFTPLLNAFYYFGPTFWLSTNQLVHHASHEFFYPWWDEDYLPFNEYVRAWVGISAGYTFNFKKK